MEYTDVEKQILSLMGRTDFKNLSKNDVISYVSKLGELRQDVAKEVLAKYPEFVGLINSALVEYKGMLDSIIESDDASQKQYYDVANKELDNADESRKQFYGLVESVHADCSKCLDNPDMTSEMKIEILEREIELIRMADKKDSEVREQEIEIERTADKKDLEKRAFNWKLVSGISAVLITLVGVSAGALGSNFNLKLPKNN